MILTCPLGNMGAAVKIYYITLKFTTDIFLSFFCVYLPFLSLSHPKLPRLGVALEYRKTLSIKPQGINKMYCFKDKLKMTG
jgi:hypothetical protein